MLNNSANWGFGGYSIEEAVARKKLKKRLSAAAKELRRDGEKYKVIPRPFNRRAILDKSYFAGITIKMQVTVRATDENGEKLDMTRIWITKNGKNYDIHRPSKGKGEYGNYGPYTFDYQPASNGITKLKVQTEGDSPSIIFYTVKQVG